jgi:ClpP class serine protease
MPSIHDIVKESDPSFILKNYIKKLSDITERSTIIYYSAWLNGPNKEGTSINDFDKNGFMSVVHELDFDKVLDLLLHTPGGSISATESIIDYLHEIFGGDIRAIIPQWQCLVEL